MTSHLPDSRAFLRPNRPLWVLFIALMLGIGSLLSAQASHFRYGSISWQPVASDPTGKTIQFKVSVAYRTSFGYNNPVVLGGTIREVAFSFGDGTSVTPDFTVTSINTAEDWFFGEVTLTHTYANAGNVVAFFASSARIGALQNNANASYRLQTTVNVGTTNRSPVATIIPILNTPAGASAATAQVPASDPDGNPLTYSLAVPADLNGLSFTQPAGLSIDASTGQLTFNTVGKTNNQLYNAIIKISDGLTATFVDLIIRIGGSGNPPTFVYTGNATPANGSTITVSPNTPISFSVTAIDTDPGSITLNAAGLPSGSSTSPALQTDGNPVVTVFSWTPTALGTSVLIFTATDPTANQASTSVTIQVRANPVNRPPVYNGLLANQTGTVGVPFSYMFPAGTFTDPDGDPLTLSASNLPPGLSLSGDMIMGTPTTITGSPFSVIITATDPGQLSATGSFQFTINPAPSTGCGSPASSIGQPLQLLAPTYNCNGNGTITFNVTGGDGSAVEFQCIPGVSVNGQGGWNVNCVQVLDAEIRSAADAPVMALQARQGNTVVTYNWDLRAVCPVTRPGPTTANQSPGLVNPIPDQTATQGQPFTYTFPANTFVDPDGDPMTFAQTGLPMGLSLSGRTISGTPTMSGPYSVTITATDGSILSTYDVFMLTVNPSGPVMGSGFAITGATLVNCVSAGSTLRQVTFTPQYSGLSGQPVTFSVRNESNPTTASGPYTLNLYIDNPTITLRAEQAGTMTSFAYNWLAACGGARKGVENSALSLTVLGNPVLNETMDVEVRGAAGESVRLQLFDGRGHRVSEVTVVGQSGVVETTLRLGRSAGLYFLNATTPTQNVVMKVLKQ